MRKENKNNHITKESLEISNEKSHIKKLKNKLTKKFYFYTNKILQNTLSSNKYQSVKNIYQKIKNKKN